MLLLGFSTCVRSLQRADIQGWVEQDSGESDAGRGVS